MAEKKRGISRRDLFRAGGATLAAIPIIETTGKALIRVGGLSGVNSEISMLTETTPSYPVGISLIEGNHLPPGKENDAVWNNYTIQGNLIPSLWQQPETKIVTNRMREAHKKNVPYILVADSEVPLFGDIPPGATNFSWPKVPHPLGFSKVSNPTDMPKSFFLVAAEPLANFGLQADNSDPLGKQKEALGNFLVTAFNPYSNQNQKIENSARQEQINYDNHVALVKAGATAAALGALAAGEAKPQYIVPTVFLAGAASYGDFLVNALGDSGNDAVNIGYQDTLPEQKKQTVLANITGENFNTLIDRWAIARTVLGYEAAHTLLKSPRLYAGDPKPETIPATGVDMLYGTLHNLGAPQILHDENFRKQAIQSFLHDLLSLANNAIDKYLPDLRSQKSQILMTIAGSLNVANVGEVTIPWGESHIEPNTSEMFDRAHYRLTQNISPNNVGMWLVEGVQKFMNAYNITS
jgi:hypothetical protein